MMIIQVMIGLGCDSAIVTDTIECGVCVSMRPDLRHGQGSGKELRHESIRWAALVHEHRGRAHLVQRRGIIPHASRGNLDAMGRKVLATDRDVVPGSPSRSDARNPHTMRPSPRLAAFTLAVGLFSSSPAWAWHIAGQVFCDRNGNQMIDGSDTTIDGVGVLITALTNSPGTTFPTTTGSGTGSYSVSLPNHDEDYRVELTSGLPVGATILIPSSGAYGEPPVGAIHLQASAFDATANFLVDGCVATPTRTPTST